AEAGIRDRNVTGVQTCALPISDLYLRLVCPYLLGQRPKVLWDFHAGRGTFEWYLSRKVGTMSLLFQPLSGYPNNLLRPHVAGSEPVLLGGIPIAGVKLLRGVCALMFPYTP